MCLLVVCEYIHSLSTHLLGSDFNGKEEEVKQCAVRTSWLRETIISPASRPGGYTEGVRVRVSPLVFCSHLQENKKVYQNKRDEAQGPGTGVAVAEV